jgi:hypothetical protein
MSIASAPPREQPTEIERMIARDVVEHCDEVVDVRPRFVGVERVAEAAAVVRVRMKSRVCERLPLPRATCARSATPACNSTTGAPCPAGLDRDLAAPDRIAWSVTPAGA